MIKEVSLKTSDNEKYGTKCGNDTIDHIYLLSLEDTKSISTWLLGSDNEWWLRSSGYNQNKAAIVLGNGFLYFGGDYVDNDDIGVRPALSLKL